MITAFKEHHHNHRKIIYQFLKSRSRTGRRGFVKKETSEIGLTIRTLMNK